MYTFTVPLLRKFSHTGSGIIAEIPLGNQGYDRTCENVCSRVHDRIVYVC